MKKKSSKKKRKISIHKIIGMMLWLVSIVVCIMLNMLNVLPFKFYAMVLGGFLILNIVIDIFLFRKKPKKFKKNTALGFAIFLILVLILPIFYMGRTLAFLWGIKDTGYNTENYSVIVLKDSKYEKIEDIKDTSVGVYENTKGFSNAKDELVKQVDVTFEKYDSTDSLGQDLLDKKVEVIFLEDSIVSMLKEDKTDFENNIKIIGTINVKIKSENEAKEVNVVSEPFSIYITGIDTYGDISSVSRSDVNIVMTVNPKTKQILLTSIPRDYYVQLHGTTGSKDKLTHAGIYGTDMSIQTIEDLLGIEINYYIKVNFSSFIDIINAIGGIEVYSKYDFTSIDGYHYVEGYNELNGEEALSFARERKAFIEGDRQRGADQQAVIEAMIKKLSNKSILTKYESLLDSIDGKFQTNMNYKKITSLIKMQLDDMATWNVVSIALDGSNGSEYTYTGGNQKLYVMIPDEATIDNASSLINAVLKGEKLDSDDPKTNEKSTRKPQKPTKVNPSDKKTNEKQEVKEEKKDDKEEPKEEIKEEKDDIIVIPSDDNEPIEIEIETTKEENVENKETEKDDKDIKNDDKEIKNDDKEIEETKENDKEIETKEEPKEEIKEENNESSSEDSNTNNEEDNAQ